MIFSWSKGKDYKVAENGDKEFIGETVTYLLFEYDNIEGTVFYGNGEKFYSTKDYTGDIPSLGILNFIK